MISTQSSKIGTVEAASTFREVTDVGGGLALVISPLSRLSTVSDTQSSYFLKIDSGWGLILMCALHEWMEILSLIANKARRGLLGVLRHSSDHQRRSGKIGRDIPEYPLLMSNILLFHLLLHTAGHLMRMIYRY